jgi:hypothetical protein
MVIATGAADRFPRIEHLVMPYANVHYGDDVPRLRGWRGTMGQVQAVSRRYVAYECEEAGEDAVGEISAQIRAFHSSFE